jgi:probable F420-dependent oxidoreductase
MRFGLSLPHYDFSLPERRPISFESLAGHARRAEALGFDSVWVSDHFLFSLERYGGGGELLGSLEPMTALGGLAAVTERVRLGTLVLSAPYRHPSVLAKMAATIDLLSDGRLDLGIGGGWYEEEFERFGYEFGTAGERFDRLEETLQGLELLFSEGPVSFDGDYVRLREAVMRPRSAQHPRPPIWLGAKGGPRALRLAARHADGWNTVWRWSQEAYAERVVAARRACEEEGRDPASLRLSIGLYSIVGEDERDLAARFDRMRAWAPGLSGESVESFGRDTLTGTPDRVLARVEELAGLGVEEIIVAPAHLPFAVPDPEMVELIAERVVRDR